VLESECLAAGFSLKVASKKFFRKKFGGSKKKRLSLQPQTNGTDAESGVRK
jgi:hypothetical protein